MRGEALLDQARKGGPLAITEYRVIIGVIIPAAEGWAQQLICQNWPQVRQSITAAEQAMATGQQMTAIQDVTPAPGPGPGRNPQGGSAAGKPTVPLDAAIVDGAVAQTPQSREAIRQLHAAWNLPAPADGEDTTADPSPVKAIRTVRIGDLSAGLIRDAGKNREALAVTHDRELIGILVPVTQDLMQFLIEQHISRVLSNIDQSEEHLESGAKMTTLDEEIRPRTPRR